MVLPPGARLAPPGNPAPPHAAPDAEDTIGPEYNAVNPAGELPMRGLLECAVFEEDAEREGSLLMRDLQCLDSDEPPTIDVVGRITLLGEDGLGKPDAPRGAQPPLASGPIRR